MNLENKEHYENIISLLKRGLELYANEDSYVVKDGISSPIQKDMGTNARFILDQTNKITDEITILDVEFDELLKENKDDFDPKKLMKKITDLLDDRN